MFSLPGNYIGDAWYFVDADQQAHCYFLTAPDSLPLDERWWNWDIGHAVSRDLVNWEYVGLALERGAGDAWDGKKLATGSVIERDGRFWMAYTGIRQDDPHLVQRVGMAVSDDLTVWTKAEGNPVTQADGVLYEKIGTGERAMGHWRDPFLLGCGDRVLQYVCARTQSDGQGCVAVASSTDMLDWKLEQPLVVDVMTEEIEVPQVYRIGGHYYLLFATFLRVILPEFRDRHPGHEFKNSDFSMVGPSPRGPFSIHGTGDVHPQAPNPYACQLVQFGDEWFLLGTVVLTVNGDGDDYITDPIPVVADETGIHAKS